MDTHTDTNAAEYIRGYTDGIESMPRNADGSDGGRYLAAYADGYGDGEERRRQIEEEAGNLIERRIRQAMPAARKAARGR